MEDEQAGMAGPAGDAAGVIGVLGAGTMGAGIAQLACRSGAHTLLLRPDRPRHSSAGSRAHARAFKKKSHAAAWRPARHRRPPAAEPVDDLGALARV